MLKIIHDNWSWVVEVVSIYYSSAYLRSKTGFKCNGDELAWVRYMACIISRGGLGVVKTKPSSW